MNLEELREQVKELDDQIASKRKELEELITFRASLGGAPPVVVPIVAEQRNGNTIIDPSVPDPRTQWSPEQAELLKREEERVREHARFNHHMPRPSVNIQRQTVQLPPGVSPASVLPPEMQEFLTK